MKVTVNDTAALGALRPLEVAAYLRAKGWRKDAELNGKGTLWLWPPEGGNEFDIALPARRDLGDYVLRIAEVLHTLASAEGRSQLDVLRDIHTVASDLIRIRTPNRDSEDGSLPLDQAVTFVERSRDMMLAAACAALDKRPVYSKRKAQQAMDYIGNVRMGQTERGSYVLTILSPVPPELKPTHPMLLPAEPVAPYERQVTRTLMDALKAMGDAAGAAAQQGDMAPFQMAVSRGVSANLCDAIVGLLDVSAGDGLDIQMAWSRTRPVEDTQPSRIQFGNDSRPFIAEAARVFRETTSVDDFEIEGIVTRLNREPTAISGEITITGNVEGRMRRLSLTLDEPTYRQATEAHTNRKTVRCTGELLKEGRGYSLQNPRWFEVLSADDDT
jgi:hypothetical protein